MNPTSFRRTTCRTCTSNTLASVLSLGATPPANSFLKKENLAYPERLFPLELWFCKTCNFVQLADVVDPNILFKDYVYVSSTSPIFVAHFESLADTITNRFSFPQSSLIVDIGSNDGILLRPFLKRGWRVLGIDPAENIAKRATASGVPTLSAFFSPEIARDVAKAHGKARIISATSVFPHIDNLDAVVMGVKTLLADNGIFVIEAYYLADLIEKNLFDTIYHEHLSYFTVGSAQKLFDRLGVTLFDVERAETHGGSLRMYVQLPHGPYITAFEHIANFMQKEKDAGLDQETTFRSFANTIATNKKELCALLKTIKNDGKRIVGYGAAAKANTLLNYFEIGTDTLDYIVDDSPFKQGLFAPGSHIPVVSSQMLTKQKPDYILILAWNFAGPIMKKLSDFQCSGGKFIIPVPKAHIV